MSDTVICCICHRTVNPPYHVLARRAYCDDHWAVLNRPHPSFWRAVVVQVAAIALLTTLVAGLAALWPELDSRQLLAAGLFLAILPTASWLWFFYRMDRLEPEPKTRLAGVFLLALALTEMAGLRLVAWFDLPGWAVGSALTSLAGSILVNGFVYTTIVYAAVRYGVYASEEFDERMDGIIYGTAAGLGVATLLNLQYVISNQGVSLAPGVVQVVTAALAQASFGGLLGYFLAQAKFEHKPLWWVPAGVVFVALVNGLFTWLIDEVSAAGLRVEPWRSLALGLVVALAAFGLLLLLMRRATALTLETETR